MENSHSNNLTTGLSHHVSIIDPNDSIRSSLTILLDDLALIQEFISGEQFLAEITLAQWSPSLIITESSLPGISGLSLFEMLNTANRKVPTIILATHNSVEEAVSAMRAGVLDYLEKPFDAARLRNQVKILLYATH